MAALMDVPLPSASVWTVSRISSSMARKSCVKGSRTSARFAKSTTATRSAGYSCFNAAWAVAAICSRWRCMLPLTSSSSTRSSGSASWPKWAIFCGRPSSKISKSSCASPGTTRPLCPSTCASTFTSATPARKVGPSPAACCASAAWAGSRMKADAMKNMIIGTAGHIDHGKTALVKALTGIDADRLEEEKRRGITIDLGFAHLELKSPNGEPLRLGFVDVPGHERFVRNMLAGVGGIDLVLLVIAADAGVKPQTREHFDICRLLAISRGIAVLTKSDLVDNDSLGVVKLEVGEYLAGSFLD